VRSVGVAGGLAETQARRSGLLHDALVAMAGATSEDEVRALRQRLGVLPVFKRIDSCAAEFEAITPYMYSTYEAPSFGEPENEADPSDRRKIVILGGGPNRIGQGIEFDYCCVHACFALSEAGYETIMVNCNPETVSTDYDTSDRLYFEPLTAEDVLEILRVEQSRGELVGVIVQFGGQTPLKLAGALEAAGVPILGTSPDAIDLAEDRDRFQKLLHKLDLVQPANAICTTEAEALALALGVKGLMNVQFAVKDGEVYLIEVNPRASRTVPFVAKAIGQPVAKVAARVMAGEKLSSFPPFRRKLDYMAVKEAVFPFARFPGVDPVLSPEMKSTGEVMGLDRDFATAFAKAQLGAGTLLPDSGIVFVSVKDSDKPVILPAVKKLVELGFTIVATGGTQKYLADAAVPVERVNKVAEGQRHIVDRIIDGEIAMIFNTTEGWQSLKDSQSIRGSALHAKVPYFTTSAASCATVEAIAALRGAKLEVRSLQAYYG
jgi:hypothetical protein